MPKEFRSLISLEEALSAVFDHLPSASTRSVPLLEASGCILAERIVSTTDVPGFSRAAMDGFAVVAGDTLEAREDRPVRLRLAGRVPMGVQAEVKLSSGEAAEVSTGSMMPGGADGVVMIEYSEAEGESVLVRRPVYAGENVQAAGSDISFGEAVLFPGAVLSARELGVLAALGRTEAPVRLLRVAVASTGDELAAPGRPSRQAGYTTSTHTQSPLQWRTAEPRQSHSASSLTRRRPWQRRCKIWLKAAI